VFVVSGAGARKLIVETRERACLKTGLSLLSLPTATTISGPQCLCSPHRGQENGCVSALFPHSVEYWWGYEIGSRVELPLKHRLPLCIVGTSPERTALPVSLAVAQPSLAVRDGVGLPKEKGGHLCPPLPILPAVRPGRYSCYCSRPSSRVGTPPRARPQEQPVLSPSRSVHRVLPMLHRCRRLLHHLPH
jgi:hypothetical protein